MSWFIEGTKNVQYMGTAKFPGRGGDAAWKYAYQLLLFFNDCPTKVFGVEEEFFQKLILMFGTKIWYISSFFFSGSREGGGMYLVFPPGGYLFPVV
jgi:hypothetical protein